MNILVLAFVLIALVIWRFVFSNLFQLIYKTSISIREKVFPDIHKTTTTLISLSSSAIILTFSVLKFVEIKNMVMKNYLVMSWIGFTLTVVSGIIAMLLLYVARTQNLIVLNSMERIRSDKSAIKELDYIKTAIKSEKVFNGFLYVQFVSFVGSMILLVLFIIKNV
ncbi:MAG: hypothetical protein PHR36_05685 [Patescibacteria group bacterium]|jgi:uncharacterized membrane protein YcjF (UPF0283 family)|nr:hypothetical protein [Patescibacteria group bacterium]